MDDVVRSDFTAKPEALSQSPAVVPATRPHFLTRSRRWIAVALALVIVAAGSEWWSTRGVSRVHYVTAPATQGDVVRTVTSTGTVNPVLTIIVGSYVSGVIQQLFCDYNTEVKAGQVCAKIDPRPYQTVVDQAKADLAVAQAQLEKDQANAAYEKLNSARNATLAQHQNVSQDTADNAKNAFGQAQAQIALDRATIAQRQAQLDAAQINLGYTDIASPVDGTVVSRNVTQGQTVAASFQTPTLFLIATDLTKMQVDTNVSESDIGGIKQGDKATFTVDAAPKRFYEGTVTQVRQSPQTVQNVVTFDAVISVDNRDLSLMPGMTASTQVAVDRRNNVVRVPSQALRYTPAGSPTQSDQPHVWVLRDGRPVLLPVTPGLDDDSFTEIVKGDIRPADQIITGEAHGSTGAQPPSHS
jgi:HlyD family secretion protein